MIHVLAIITAKPGMRDTILEAFRANMPAVLVEVEQRQRRRGRIDQVVAQEDDTQQAVGVCQQTLGQTRSAHALP